MYEDIPLLPDVISKLIQRDITEEEFCRQYGIPLQDGSRVAWILVERAATARDSRALTLSLSLVFHFGVSRDHLDTLVRLAQADWHCDHENVLDALSDLEDPASVDTIAAMASATYKYRAYDDAYSLRVKCAWLLARIQTRGAVVALGNMLRSSHGGLRDVICKRLDALEREATSPEVRELASRILHNRQPV